MPRITISQKILRERLPRTQHLTVGPAQIDLMGHMNVGAYGVVFADASREMTARVGVTEVYVAERRLGAFMLRNFSQFIAEAHEGQVLSVYTRVVARSAKRYQYMHFMLNDTTGLMAATCEVLTTHADLETRRSAPFPPEVIAQIDTFIADHNTIDWTEAPLCGLLAP
ncbi:MAG: thioesterase family protein [Chloroflexota bacterium]